MTTTTLAPTRLATTTKQKVGLVLGALYCLSNIPSFLEAPDPGTTGPPLSILVIDTILGVIGLVAAIWAWRGNRLALRVAAGSIILITLTSLPAFFVDVPMWLKAIVGASVVLTVAIVVLMFSGDRQAQAVVD